MPSPASGKRLGEHFAERRTNPRDDVFTDLVEAEVTDETGEVRRLTDAELADFGILLFSAGTETVARHLGLGRRRARRVPRTAGRAGEGLLADPERGGGDPAVRATVAGERPLDDRATSPLRT